jgi:hypothetical protein
MSAKAKAVTLILTTMPVNIKADGTGLIYGALGFASSSIGTAPPRMLPAAMNMRKMALSIMLIPINFLNKFERVRTVRAPMINRITAAKYG